METFNHVWIDSKVSPRLLVPTFSPAFFLLIANSIMPAEKESKPKKAKEKEQQKTETLGFFDEDVSYTKSEGLCKL